MESEEIVKMLIFIVVLVVVVAGVIFLLKGKGGELLAGIKRGLRLG